MEPRWPIVTQYFAVCVIVSVMGDDVASCQEWTILQDGEPQAQAASNRKEQGEEAEQSGEGLKHGQQ